jgi:hypothetical protein
MAGIHGRSLEYRVRPKRSGIGGETIHGFAPTERASRRGHATGLDTEPRPVSDRHGWLATRERRCEDQVGARGPAKHQDKTRVTEPGAQLPRQPAAENSRICVLDLVPRAAPQTERRRRGLPPPRRVVNLHPAAESVFGEPGTARGATSNSPFGRLAVPIERDHPLAHGRRRLGRISPLCRGSRPPIGPAPSRRRPRIPSGRRGRQPEAHPLEDRLYSASVGLPSQSPPHKPPNRGRHPDRADGRAIANRPVDAGISFTERLWPPPGTGARTGPARYGSGSQRPG